MADRRGAVGLDRRYRIGRRAGRPGAPDDHLSHAAGLLATTRLSHHEIAYLSGYGTEAALAKAFKRERGETLGAHRPAARGAPEINVAASAA
ncbi:MAG TPA: hypothetical protein VMA96_10025 [Solirubrobacteraceae bacterium]|nr:hypothetical protein [Solirubrobacteraceae bacterium]